MAQQKTRGLMLDAGGVLIGRLKRRGIRATFFVPGHPADRFPDVVWAIRDAGHEIGSAKYGMSFETRLTPTDPPGGSC
jgi:hypothetical protein